MGRLNARLIFCMMGMFDLANFPEDLKLRDFSLQVRLQTFDFLLVGA